MTVNSSNNQSLSDSNLNLLSAVEKLKGKGQHESTVTVVLAGFLQFEKQGSSLGSLYEKLFSFWNAQLEAKDKELEEISAKTFSKVSRGNADGQAETVQKQENTTKEVSDAATPVPPAGAANGDPAGAAKDGAVSDSVTGLLACQKHTFVHFIETSQRMANVILQHASSSPENVAISKEFIHPSIPLDEQLVAFPAVRLLYYSDSLGKRIFPSWQHRSTIDARGLPAQPVSETSGARFVGLQEEDQAEVLRLAEDSGLAAENIAETLTDTVLRLIQLGQTLQNMTASELKASLNNLFQTYRTLIPEATLVHALALSNNILSLKNFTTAFSGTPQVTLESELTWPVLQDVTF